MKKSTLITTIAMIVVVVVALSTATYAWFSAATVSTAGAEMTTLAQSDWMIFQGTAGVSQTATKEYTFTNSAAQAIDLQENAIASGIWSPAKSTFANAISISGSTASVTSQEFIVAKKASSGNEVTVANTVVDPYVFKVSNASGATKSLNVTVVVNAGLAEKTGSLYAAVGTVFDISYFKTGDQAATGVNNGYYKTATTEAVEVTDAVTATAKTTASTFNTGSTATDIAYENATNMSGNPADYTYFLKAGADGIPDWGIAANEYYLAYTFTVANVTATQSVYLSIYSWIDGWAVDNSAGAAAFKVTYAFTTAAAAPANNG